MRLYLDVCCCNRPFDDQAIDRNRLEAEAVLAITAKIRGGIHSLVSSEIIDREIDACPDTEKAEFIRQMLLLAGDYEIVTGNVVRRWEQLVAYGFRELD